MWNRWATDRRGRRISAIDLGHNDDRTAYTGLEHRICNRRDGQRKTSAILRANGYQLTPKQRAAIRAKAQAKPKATPNDGARLMMAAPIEGRAYRKPPSRW